MSTTSSSELESPGQASGPSSRTDFTKKEDEAYDLALKRFLKLLKDPKSEIPPGQLMSFLGKVGYRVEQEKPEHNQIKQQNIFAILPGLPPERQEQILAGFEREIQKARKELPSGR